MAGAGGTPALRSTSGGALRYLKGATIAHRGLEHRLGEAKLTDSVMQVHFAFGRVLDYCGKARVRRRVSVFWAGAF